MKKKSLTPLHVIDMTLENACSLFSMTCDISIPVRNHISETCDAILSELVVTTCQLAVQLNRSRKSKYTDLIS